ncbi:MAG: isochorismate synthase, partial [Ancrocorticia sp.]
MSTRSMGSARSTRQGSRSSLIVDVQLFHGAPANLLDVVPEPAGLLAWLGSDMEIVGWGEAARIDAVGEHAMREASRMWAGLADAATVNNSSGYSWAERAPFAIASFGFAEGTPGFVAVPEIAVVRRGGEAVVVTARVAGVARGPVPSIEPVVPGDPASPMDSASPIKPAAPADPASPAELFLTKEPVTSPGGLRTAPGRMTQSRWRASLDQLIEELKAGAASKVVLSRDILVTSESPIDERFLAQQLRDRYGSTWVFAADGLIGATPEMLAAADSGKVRSRVLAGTASPGAGQELLDSVKNRNEHHFAVESVARALAPLANELDVPAEPFLLELPNVVHLATDVTATISRGSALDIADALHPTAAVCGTPTMLAADLLKKLEGTQRGRYSGPVGWIDRAGSGEFGIALRCGQLAEDRRSIRLFAGGGIMPDSIPSVELAETSAKMR